MDTDTVPSQRQTSSILSVPQLKVAPDGENSSNTFLSIKCEKAEDFHLKFKSEECSDNEFIKSSHIGRFEIIKEELDQKKSNLFLEESVYIKLETETLKNLQLESNDRNIGKEYNNDVIEPHIIKKEPNNVTEAAAEELTHNHGSLFKSETIKQEEVDIKDEESMDYILSEKVLEPRKQSLLHQCPECPYSTNRKCHLNTHMLKHKNGDEIHWYRCHECPYKTYRERDLLRHSEIHNVVLLNCLKCSYETLRLSELKKHQMEHRPNIQWLHCPECSFKTHLQRFFRRHLLIHKSDSFKCSKCSYQASTRNQLAVHQVEHESNDKWHSCPLCPFKSHTKNVFEVHCQRRHNINLNNPKQIKLFKCTECPYESGSKYSVKEHQLIHDESIWRQCPSCVYKTPNKRSLKKHQVGHQGENTESWHRCPECPFTTTICTSLRRHVMSHKSAVEIR